MEHLDSSAKLLCKKFLDDLLHTTKEESSIKFFRKDISTMLVWLFIMDAHSNNKEINIEDIARGIAVSTTISKPSLRLILENAKEKGYIKFTHNKKDNRSWIIEPEVVAIIQFNSWINGWSNYI